MANTLQYAKWQDAQYAEGGGTPGMWVDANGQPIANGTNNFWYDQNALPTGYTNDTSKATPTQVHGPLDFYKGGQWYQIPEFSYYSSSTTGGAPDSGAGTATTYYDKDGKTITDPYQSVKLPGGTLIHNVDANGQPSDLWGSVSTGDNSFGSTFMDQYGAQIAFTLMTMFAGAAAAGVGAAGGAAGAAGGTGELGSLGAAGSVIPGASNFGVGPMVTGATGSPTLGSAAQGLFGAATTGGNPLTGALTGAANNALSSGIQSSTGLSPQLSGTATNMIGSALTGGNPFSLGNLASLGSAITGLGQSTNSNGPAGVPTGSNGNGTITTSGYDTEPGSQVGSTFQTNNPGVTSGTSGATNMSDWTDLISQNNFGQTSQPLTLDDASTQSQPFLNSGDLGASNPANVDYSSLWSALGLSNPSTSVGGLINLGDSSNGNTLPLDANAGGGSSSSSAGLGGLLTQALGKLFGGGGGTGSTAGGGTAGGSGGNSLLGTILGALIGSQNSVGPVSQNSAPWNAALMTPLMNQAQTLSTNNNLNLPGVPTLPNAPNNTTDQYTQAAIQNALVPMRQSFTDPGGALSAIRSDFGTTGGYGSSRQGLAEGIAAGRESQAEGNVAAQMANAMYGTNLQNQMQQYLANTANTQWNYGQQVNNAQSQFTAPWTNLTNLGNILTGAAGKGTTTTTQLPSQNPLIGALGGALTGSQLGKQLGV